MAFFTKTRKLIIGGTVIDVEFSKYGPESVQIGDVVYGKNSDVAKSFTSKFCQFLEENSKKDEAFAFENRLLWNNEDTKTMLYAQEISFRKAFSKQLKETLERGSLKGVEDMLQTGIIRSKSLLELAREEMEKPRGFKGAIYKAVKGALDFSLRDSIEKLSPTVDISKYTTANHDFSREGDAQEVSKEDIMQAAMLDFMRIMTETQKQLSTELEYQRKIRESQERVEAVEKVDATTSIKEKEPDTLASPIPALTMDKLFEANANAAFDVKPQNEQEEIEQIIAQDTVNREYQKQLDAEEQAKQSQSSSQKLN